MPVRMRKGKTYAGAIGTFREGQTITDDDLAEILLKQGDAEEFTIPDPTDEDPSSEEAEEPEPPAEPPNKSALKAEWVAWAVEHQGLDPAKANDLTVKKLQALVDSDD